MKNIRFISPQIINRLPKYLRCLNNLAHQGNERTSSSQLAKILGTTASQVRQDFSVFGSYGAIGYGYSVDKLIREIENIMGVNKTHEIAIIGVGCIGRAMLEHMDFDKYHYNVCAAFDIDPNVIGSAINGVPIYDIAEITTFHKNHPIDICMLTVSRSSAKSVAHQLYHLGISAIWNFTNEDLQLNENDMVIQDVNFLDSLFVLTYYLEEYNKVKYRKFLKSM